MQLSHFILFILAQLAEYKKKADESGATMEELDELKKKVGREVEALMQENEQLRAQSDKFEKSKKKLQQEV